MTSVESTTETPVAAPPAAPVSVASLEKVNKPDKSIHEEELAKLNADIKKFQERTQQIRSEIDSLKSGRTEYGEQIQAAKAVFSEIRAQKDALIQQRNEITAKLRAAQGKKDAHVKNQKQLRSEIKYTSADEIEKQIASLRHQQETQSMSLQEEKKVIKEIESLQQSRKLVAKYATEQGEMDKHFDSIKGIRALHDKKNSEIDAVSEKLGAQKKVLDELYTLNNSQDRESLPKLIEERKALKTKVDEKYNAIRALRTKFKEENDKYFNYVRALREAKKQERVAEDNRRKAEYESKLAEYEAEMAKIHPYQTEIDLCEALLKYLQSTYAKELATQSDDSSSATVSTGNSVELDGMKPLKRVEEDFMNFGGKSKSKKGKKGKKKSDKGASLSIPIAQLESFTTVGVLPPSSTSALKGAVDAIKEKKAFFEGKTARETPVADAAGEIKEEKKAPVKKTNKKFNAEASEFPSLGTAVGSMSLGSVWGGSGPAVAPPSAEAAAPTPAESVAAAVAVEDETPASA